MNEYRKEMEEFQLNSPIWFFCEKLNIYNKSFRQAQTSHFTKILLIMKTTPNLSLLQLIFSHKSGFYIVF